MKAIIDGDRRDLFLAGEHLPQVRRERYGLILSRAQSAADLFMYLTIAWIVVDISQFSWPLWGILAAQRLLAAVGFLVIARREFLVGPRKDAYFALAGLVAIPVTFFLSANFTFWLFQAYEQSVFAATAYFYLPFLLAAGLGIFPLTAIEAALFASPILFAMCWSVFWWPELLGSASPLATVWRLFLMAGIGGCSGMSQLGFLLSLVRHTTCDALTGALARKFGEQLLDVQFALAERRRLPLAVLFVDLDTFKVTNDRFGHEAGDAVLRAAARSIRQCLRHQDSIVRWGGEEFLVILPATDQAGAESVIGRIAASGLGLCPDGAAQTASIGVAERIRDRAHNWSDLVERADERMYAAKRAGRNRYVTTESEPALLFRGAAGWRGADGISFAVA